MAALNNNIPSPETEITPQPEPGLSFFQRLVAIFVDPLRLFEDLRNRPSWLLPLMLVIFSSILFTVVTKDYMIEFRKEMIYDSRKMSEEMKDQAIDQLENMTPRAYYLQSAIGGVIGVLFIYLIASGIFLMTGNFVLGGKATFKQIFALYVWGNMVTVVEYLLKMFLVVQKGSMHVYTSLAILMDPSEYKTVTFQVLNAFDVFAIWKVILWSIGFAVIYRFSYKKAYATIITLYVLFTLFSIGLGQLFV